MKKILFVGEHPLSQTGNGHMMRAILQQLNYEEYAATCFCSNRVPPVMFSALPVQIVSAEEGNDFLGHSKLINMIALGKELDVLVMVGIDLWKYVAIFDHLRSLREKKRFKWVWIFPYDLQEVRNDWVEWINQFDFPCVYSHYGEKMLKDKVKNLRYFRPPLDQAEVFKPYSEEKRLETRVQRFRVVGKDQFVFGYIGANQIRKDPQRLIKAFARVKESIPDAVLYLHTDLGRDQGNGVFNLYQYMIDCGFKDGDVIGKNGLYSPLDMVDLYNSMDCLVNCSTQEGLSWTLLEAMLCEVPVIATDTTAQTELVKDVGLLVSCKEDTFVPVVGKHGQTYGEAKHCRDIDLADAMLKMAGDVELRAQCKERGLAKAKTWLDGISNINELLAEATKPKIIKVLPRKKQILFAQHSAAGDVLMTTRCFKGVKEIYTGLPLVYMTSPQYMNIIEGNPYVDELIPWDDALLKDGCQVVVNPHGERILPGHWGRNSNSLLSDFYWKILNIDPDDFYINLKKPKRFSKSLNSDHSFGDFVIVHTTGGDPHFRTYKYMMDVCHGLHDMGFFTVQLGSKNDYPAGSDMDLRGEFSFQEAAWAMNKAVLAITVDSFISHLAGVLGVSQVCLFGSGNVNVVRPNQMRGELICLAPDYIHICKGLGPCSASVRDCPAPCTGSHDPIDVLKAVTQIQANGNIRRNYQHEKALYSIQYAE